MRFAIAFSGLIALALTASADAATLNKCTDAQGRITYSNLPCRNAREARTVEIDPAPPPEPAHARPAGTQIRQAAAKTADPKPASRSKQTAPSQVEARSKPVAQASMRQCDTLTDKLGRVFDKMDQARRKGYTQKQMDAWDLEVKELERKKQHAGCF